MSVPQSLLLTILSVTSLLANATKAQSADEHVAGQSANGTIYSEVIVRDHLAVIPFPSVHSPLTRGSIDSWLVRWTIARLNTKGENYPDQTNFLAHQIRTGQMAYGFRPGPSSNWVTCNTAKAVELYSIGEKKRAQLLASIPADDPATNRPPVRLFSRSGEYLFLWKPAPAIYALSNFTVVKHVSMTQDFKHFVADLQREGGWLEVLTDDLKYLIHVPLEFGGTFNQEIRVDTPHCYNLETGEYETWQIHAGTNQTAIVSAESVGGSPLFIVFYEASGSKHLAILDKTSRLLAHLPIKGTQETQFDRNCSWDYAHSRFFIREPGGKLTIYDYRTHQKQQFLLAHPELKLP